MNKIIALCFVFLSFLHVAIAQSCSASAIIIERPGGWQENGVQHRIFDLQITNTHATCTIKDSVKVNLVLPGGSSIKERWQITASGLVSGFYELKPSHSHSGAGFILAGHGTPTATVSDFTNCVCPGGNPTLAPENPPTDPPTPTITPTPPPTPAPTPSPTPSPRPTTAPGQGTYYTLGLKVAIFSCNAATDIRLPVAKLAFDSVGTSYTVYDSASGGAAFNLANSDGNGKFYAFVSTTAFGLCSGWTEAQKAEVIAYELRYRVKNVILYAYPTYGVSVIDSISINETGVYSYFAPSMMYAATAIHLDAQIPVNGVYLYLAQLAPSATATATPALYLHYRGAEYMIGALINYADGRFNLEFYIDQANWALFPIIYNPVWVDWVTNGIFAGARRIEFNVHMDDIFMNTGTFTLEAGTEDDTITYRITPDDMQATANWQTALNANLPAGSNFTLTFPFNGATVIEEGGYAVDELFLKGKELLNQFIWETHTWSHLYLHELDYNTVVKEFRDNDATAIALMGANFMQHPRYCPKSTITPSISGLFNRTSLKGMVDYGIKYVVGDNSRPELIPSNLYHGIHTNVTTHGYAGIYIVPRHATNIYYDGNLPVHITDQYNFRYNKTQGFLTFEEVVEKDVDVATKSLLAWRADPFMMHQANLRFDSEGYADGNVHSLMSFWVDQVIESIMHYTHLPIISRTHDELARMWLDREDRDACGFSGTLKMEDGSNVAVGVTVQSTGKCTFGISGVSVATNNTKVQSVETYGTEKTTWLKMTAGSNFYVDFTSPVLPL